LNIDRLGHLFSIDHSEDNFTHAANPFPLVLTDQLLRIFFNRRDHLNRSIVFSADYVLDASGFHFKKESLKKLLGPGEIGAFDDSGVSVGSIQQLENGNYYLYYMGWNLGVTVPWRNSIGCAFYDIQNNLLVRERKAPIIDRSEEDPFTLSYPWCVKVKEKNKYYLFYGSNQRWNTSKVDIDHVLKVCESEDGFYWKNRKYIDFKFPELANAFCRPSVLKVSTGYLLAYAFRKQKYQIGFLFTEDFIHWKNSFIFSPLVASTWESEEVTYPALFEMAGRIFILYCGNGYGKTGFGIGEIKL
jgi:hypothetical protein